MNTLALFRRFGRRSSRRLRTFVRSGPVGTLAVAAALLVASSTIAVAPPPVRAAGPNDGPRVEPLPPLDLNAMPDRRPSGAHESSLRLQIKDLAYDTETAIVVPPRQVMAMTLVADDGRLARNVPPLRNSPDGDGPGGALAAHDQRVEWSWSAGSGIDLNGRMLTWRAPAAGGRYVIGTTLHELERLAGAVNDRLAERWGRAEFNVFVLEPFDPKEFMLNGVAIGIYPDPADEGAPAVVQQNVEKYRAPRWFLKVTPDTRRLKLSPGFTIGDFAMDEKKFGDRQYIVVDRGLLERLETIRTLAIDRGWGGGRGGVRVLRGYLTPLAAEALRRENANISTFSRFLYGDAAIIIIDGDGDGQMDDLNHDGKVDAADAMALAKICEEAEREHGFGGIGVYGGAPDATLPNTPFVHVDARGTRARWDFQVE